MKSNNFYALLKYDIVFNHLCNSLVSEQKKKTILRQ